MFRAIGVISGKLECDRNRLSVRIAEKKYPIVARGDRYDSLGGLRREVKGGLSRSRLVVYPKFTHFPERDRAPEVKFALVGYGESPFPALNEGEFYISGLWQFIPVSRVPVISVYRNQSEGLRQKIKDKNDVEVAKLLKANHIPAIMRGNVQPHRYSKDCDRDPFFIQIAARFLFERNCLGYMRNVEPPSKEVPPYYKRKRIKALAF